MKRINGKLKKYIYENINIRHRVFYIIFSLIVVTSIMVITVMAFILPVWYKNEKKQNFDEISKNLIASIRLESESLAVKNINDTAKTSPMYIKLVSPDNKIVLEKNRFVMDMNRKSRPYDINNFFIIRKKITLLNDLKPYDLTIGTQIFPQKDTFETIKDLTPLIVATVSFFAILISYAYSYFIAKPLLRIIDNSKNEIYLRKNFMSSVSHELRTPITIISGQLEGMIHNVGKYKDRDKYLISTYKSLNDLNQLVNSMIDICSSDLAELNFHMEVVDLNDIIDSSIECFSNLLDSKNMSVIKHIGHNTKVYANRRYLDTCVKNILSNAIKYSPENEKIIISVYEYKKVFAPIEIRFTVENTGVTIKNDEIKNLFEPFYRVDSSRNKDTGGSGLGLYFVSELLKKQGCKYEIYCKEKSTVFSVDIKPYNESKNN